MTEASDDHRRALDVSRETIQRLTEFADLVKKWNLTINLVSKDSIAQIWQRHVVDSAQIFGFGNGATHWADLGSGGGFPGIIVAILAAEKSVGTRVTLVEADQRKAAFLRETSRTLGLSVDVIAERIEKISGLEADVLSARALAPLPQLFEFASRHLTPEGTAIFMKGRTYLAEVEAARKTWAFTVETHASITDPEAVTLVLKGITHV